MRSLTVLTIAVCVALSGFVIYFAGPWVPGLVGYFAGIVSSVVIAVAAIIEADETSIHDAED